MSLFAIHSFRPNYPAKFTQLEIEASRCIKAILSGEKDPPRMIVLF